MKITPLELRQFEFEKTFRGYSIEEVDMFINNLAQEWERVLTETKMMRMQLELAEKEATKLREIEMTLFKTLKTAEDTSTMITEQANQQAARNISEASLKAEKQLSEAAIQAEKQVAEANIQAEQILSNARLKASEIIQQAEQKSTYIKEDVLSDVKAIEKDFASLKIYQENLLSQLKNLANTTVDHVNRFETKFDISTIESKIQKANELIEEPNLSILNTNAESSESHEFIEETTLNETEEEVNVENIELEAEQRSVEEEIIAPDIIEESIDNDLLNLNYLTEPHEVLENEVVEVVLETTEIKEDVSLDLDEEIIDENFGIAAETVIEEIVPNPNDNKDVVEIIEEEFEKEVQLENEISVIGNEPQTVSILSSSVNNLAVDSSSESKNKVSQIISSKLESFKISSDDLTKIEGIGPKIQEVLAEHGIKTFRDLATTPLYKIKDYLNAEGPHFNMVDSSTWTEQALLAAEGRWEDLEQRQKELIGGREVEEVAETVVETNTQSSENNKPVSNLENITDEMLEKVNKVKNAIRKAMTEKPDKPESEKDSSDKLPTIDDVLKKSRNKGGSFFDNID